MRTSLWTEGRVLEVARGAFRECGAGLTMREFVLRTRVPESRIVTLFGGWLRLKERVGMMGRPVVPDRCDPERRPAVLVEKVREHARVHGPEFSLTEFCRATGMSRQTVYRAFGNWPALRMEAGLTPKKKAMRTSTPEQAAADMLRVLMLDPQQRFTCDLYDSLGRIGLRTILRRFGSWSKALDAMFLYGSKLTGWFPNPPDRIAHIEQMTAGLSGRSWLSTRRREGDGS